MTNEEILNTRWNNVDKYLKDYLKNYKKVNRKTRDNIQKVFNEINITYNDINKPISKVQKERLDRFILDTKEKGLLSGYFGYKARLIYSKKNVTYLEMLEIMLMACFVEENNQLDEYNNLLYYDVCKDSYEKGIEDIGKMKKIRPISFKLPILYTLLNIPIFNTTAENYMYSLSISNAEETLKNTLINIQLNKELNVDNKYYKDLFDKQVNRLINVNDDKFSGGIVNIVDNLTNEAYLQAGIDTDTDKCRFVAEMDKRTTKMCQTLDNQIFNINEMNVYQRYSEADKRIVTYHTKGLVQGENLPPINNHFHWCRSTITYQLDEKIANMIRDNIKIANEYDKEQYSRYKKYFGDKIPSNVEDFVKMKYNNHDEWESLKQRYQDAKLSYKIKNEYNLNININKFNKHIVGTKEYQQYLAKNPAPSVLYINVDEAQNMINKYAGNGKLIRKNGKFDNKEYIIANKEIGHVIDINNNQVITNKAYIHYSKTGTHLVPTLKE